MNNSPTLPDIISLSSDKPRIKYGAAKQFISLSQTHPKLLSPHFDFFIKLMDSNNHILKWTAIDVVGNLILLEDETTTQLLLKKFYGFLREGKLITAAHAISALGTIAKTKIEYQKNITSQLLKTEIYTYESEECKNIVLGKTILALSSYGEAIAKNNAVLEFINRQTNNSRNATKKKAEKLLIKLSKNI